VIQNKKREIIYCIRWKMQSCRRHASFQSVTISFSSPSMMNRGSSTLREVGEHSVSGDSTTFCLPAI